MSLFRKKYSYGILAPDYYDPRDYLLSDVQPIKVALPDEFDLRSQQSPIQNQNGLGICYSFMIAGIGEYWNTKEYHQLINLAERFVVYQTKKISGLWNIQGDYFRNSLKAFCDYGAPLETDYPFSTNWEDYKKEPPEDIIKKALEFKGKTFWRVNTDLESIRQAVFQNICPLGFGMPWYKSYNIPEPDGRLPLSSGKMVGGHAISGGYWTKEKLWFKNSWSSNWGNQGYFYIPFQDFSKYEIWDAEVLLDLPKPVVTNEGWVAENYLRKIFIKGDIVFPYTRLNIRKIPAGKIIRTLNKEEKLEILGETQQKNNYLWQKVKII